jgi:hypothetical protein
MDISSKRFRLNEPTVAADVIDGEAIIINLEKGDYFSLTSTGAEYWRMLSAGLTVDEIAAAAAGHFRLDVTQVEPHLSDLARRLVLEGLIVPSENADPGLSEIVFGSSSYESPELSVFSDVKDLIALDPPLPDYARRAKE